MKKALQISIAQTLFTIEDDAYSKLDAYLSSIRAHFAQTEGKDDIISDIESRISEQFSEQKNKIITLEQVDAVISSMGTIADFDGVTDTPSSASEKVHAHKKLYRNSDDKILAGVCSGLAVYLNTDPLWIRIAAILLTLFTNGIAIIAYIILAIILPEAKTASQKLEMEGSPVTLDTLSKNVKDTAEEIRIKHGSKIKGILSFPFVILKKIADFLRKYIFPFFRIVAGIFLLITSLLGIFALSVLAPLILTNNSAYFGFPITDVISSMLFYFTIIATYIALVIPCVVIFMSALGIIGKRNLINVKTGMTFFVIWFIATVCTGVTGFNVAYKIETYTSPLRETITREIPVSGTPHALKISSDAHITYIQGTTTSLSITGNASLMDSFKTEITEDTLNLRISRSNSVCLFCNFGTIEATITLPHLDSVILEQGSRMKTDSWTSTTSTSVIANQGSYGKFVIYSPEISATVSQGSRIILSGTGEHATLTATQGSTIDAQDAEIPTIKATAHEGSRIIHESTDVDADEDTSSTISN